MIEKAAVFGAGIIGRGIALAIATAGIDVAIVDITMELAEEGKRHIDMFLSKQISRYAITESEKNVMLSRITPAVDDDPEPYKSASIVLSALPEDFDLKVKMFTKLDKILPPETIFVTNTATLSITEIASKLSRKERFIGLHFPNPHVKDSKIVQLVRGYSTSDETVEIVKGFVKQIKKESIEVNEYPGYVTTRAILPFINEAAYIVMEGVSSASDVDKALTLGYNLRIGPLELADNIGLHNVLSWMEHLFHELGDLKYRPCPLIRKLVRAGHLGIKTKEGFFKYDDNENRTN